MTDNEKISRFIGIYGRNIDSSIQLEEAVLFLLQNKHRTYPDITVPDLAFGLERLADEAMSASQWLKKFNPRPGDERTRNYRGNWELKDSLLEATIDELFRIVEEESHDPQEQLEKLGKKLYERCKNQSDIEALMTVLGPRIVALDKKARAMRRKGLLLEGEIRFGVLRFLFAGWKYFQKIEHKFSAKDVGRLLKYAEKFCIGRKKYRPIIVANALRLVVPEEVRAAKNAKRAKTRPKAK